jgi:hypothetical protein
LEWLVSGPTVSCNSLAILVDCDLGLCGGRIGRAVHGNIDWLLLEICMFPLTYLH